MGFDKLFLENLRDRISIVDVVSRHVPLTNKGKENWGRCPFHNEKTASFSVNEQKKFYHCFGCGAHGDIISFTMQIQHLSFIEAVEKLCNDAGIEIPVASEEQRKKDKEAHELYEVLNLALEFFKKQLYSEEGKHALDYLKKRGLSDEIISNFHICYAPNGNKLIKYLEEKNIPVSVMVKAGLARRSEKNSMLYDYFRDRVLFPITDFKGRVVAFGGRVMDDSLPKYLNSPESLVFSKGKNLYGFAQARVEAIEKKQVIATEGYMDTISLHQFGFRCAVAPLGTAITESQIELLWRLAPEPILCFDSDSAGRKAGIRAALRVLPILKPGYSLKFCLIEGAKDPDEFLHAFGHDEFQKMLNTKSISLSDILWMYFSSDKKIETPEQRAGLEQEIKQEFSRIKSESIRKFYLNDFASSMKKQFVKVSSSKNVVIPKANPENSNEKMILAFSIAYPDLFSKFLERGKTIQLEHPVYKKIFTDVVNEISVNPHTRTTILKFLNDKGYNPQVLLKFELASLVNKPESAEKILEEKIARCDLEKLNAELKFLNAQLFSVPESEIQIIREKINLVKKDIEEINHRLEQDI